MSALTNRMQAPGLNRFTNLGKGRTARDFSAQPRRFFINGVIHPNSLTPLLTRSTKCEPAVKTTNAPLYHIPDRTNPSIPSDHEKSPMLLVLKIRPACNLCHHLCRPKRRNIASAHRTGPPSNPPIYRRIHPVSRVLQHRQSDAEDIFVLKDLLNHIRGGL